MSNMLQKFGDNLNSLVNTGKELLYGDTQTRLDADSARAQIAVYQQQKQAEAEGPQGPHYAAQAPEKRKFPRIPALFRSNIWPYAIAVLFLNNKIQKAELENHQVVEEIKITALTQEQMGDNGPFTAAVQEITYNMVTQERDTVFALMANPDRLALSLGDNGYRSSAETMNQVNDALNQVGQGSDKMSRISQQYLERKNALLPLSDDVMNKLKFKHYQVMGVQEFNDADKMKSYYQGKQVGDYRADYIFENRNALTNAFFPTGKATFSISDIFGNQGAFKSADPKNVGDAVDGVEKVAGVNVHWKDALQKFQENTELVGYYPITGDQYIDVVAHKKPKLK